MNVGEAAKAAGLTVKTVHYYEQIGLIVPDRQDNGYREFDDFHIHKLRFVQRARGLGFSVDDCRSLLSLYEDKNRVSADVKAIAKARLADIERKVRELESFRATLSSLIDACHGDHRPDCPILNDLAGLGTKRAAMTDG